jgi:hypothetical protein
MCPVIHACEVQSTMIGICTICRKRIRIRRLHQHGEIVYMTKSEFQKFDQDQFLQNPKQNDGVIHCASNNGSLTFYSPWCFTMHQHGKIDGHRVAHCSTLSDSPFRRYGYYIKLKENIE